jgi:hypothetical protein
MSVGCATPSLSPPSEYFSPVKNQDLSDHHSHTILHTPFDSSLIRCTNPRYFILSISVHASCTYQPHLPEIPMVSTYCSLSLSTRDRRYPSNSLSLFSRFLRTSNLFLPASNSTTSASVSIRIMSSVFSSLEPRAGTKSYRWRNISIRTAGLRPTRAHWNPPSTLSFLEALFLHTSSAST